MQTSLICFIVLAFLAAGCGTTDRFSHVQAKAHAFDINFHAARGPVTIQLSTRTEPYKADFFTIYADSAFWTEPFTGATLSAPISAIKKISVRDRPTGLINGMLIGAGVGVGTVYATNDRENATEVIAGSYLVCGLLGYVLGFNRNFVFE